VIYLKLQGLEKINWGGELAAFTGIDYTYQAAPRPPESFEEHQETVKEFEHTGFVRFNPDGIKTDIIERSWDDLDIPDTAENRARVEAQIGK